MPCQSYDFAVSVQSDLCYYEHTVPATTINRWFNHSIPLSMYSIVTRYSKEAWSDLTGENHKEKIPDDSLFSLINTHYLFKTYYRVLVG